MFGDLGGWQAPWSLQVDFLHKLHVIQEGVEGYEKGIGDRLSIPKLPGHGFQMSPHFRLDQVGAEVGHDGHERGDGDGPLAVGIESSKCFGGILFVKVLLSKLIFSTKKCGINTTMHLHEETDWTRRRWPRDSSSAQSTFGQNCHSCWKASSFGEWCGWWRVWIRQRWPSHSHSCQRVEMQWNRGHPVLNGHNWSNFIRILAMALISV